MAIADFVKQGKKLTELNLYMNDIGDTGAYKVRHKAGPNLSSFTPLYVSSTLVMHLVCTLLHQRCPHVCKSPGFVELALH